MGESEGCQKIKSKYLKSQSKQYEQTILELTQCLIQSEKKVKGFSFKSFIQKITKR